MLDSKKIASQIHPLDRRLCMQAQAHWDTIAKPLRSLGQLEELVIQLAGIQNTLQPRVDKKAVLVFCADNGVVEEGVTQTSREVTATVAENFTKGIATINTFSRLCGAQVVPVDIGIAKDMQNVKGIRHCKVAAGTANMANGPAMTKAQCEQAICTGMELVREYKEKGYQMIITGEMGIGNTTTSSALLAVLENIPVEQVTGKGAGLTSAGVQHKIAVIRRAIAVNGITDNSALQEADAVLDVMRRIGGYDICGMCGAFLGGAIYRVPVLIDGLISAVAANCAIRIAPGCREYVLATHQSAEPAGQLALKAIGKKAYIEAGLCLGEGTGAVLGAQLLDYALAAYYESASFADAEVAQYELLQ